MDTVGLKRFSHSRVYYHQFKVIQPCTLSSRPCLPDDRPAKNDQGEYSQAYAFTCATYILIYLSFIFTLPIR
jgi:hypothetical protein